MTTQVPARSLRAPHPALLAIDPGSEQSAWMVYVNGRPQSFGINANPDVRQFIKRWNGITSYAIEQIESYGMPVGREVFATVFWTGRFVEAAFPAKVELVPRRRVKLRICGDSRAKDGNIRIALMDRFGGKPLAVGTSKAPGPLYGISRDVWSALAIAVTWQEENVG